jgi:hypothetical protein
LSVAYDAESKTIALEARRAAADGSRAWRVHALTPAVELGALGIRSVAVDGQMLDAGAFRIEFPEHEPRGLIELTLERPGTVEAWSIVLLPGAVQAEMVEAALSMELVRPIDLDAQGSGGSPW